MSAFDLVLKFHAENADINALLDKWLQLSDQKQWPKTEEGLGRFLSRLEQTGGEIPRRPCKLSSPKTIVPAAFVSFWKEHSESGYCEDVDQYTVPPIVAWRCLRYQKEWEIASKASRREDLLSLVPPRETPKSTTGIGRARKHRACMHDVRAGDLGETREDESPYCHFALA